MIQPFFKYPINDQCDKTGNAIIKYVLYLHNPLLESGDMGIEVGLPTILFYAAVAGCYIVGILCATAYMIVIASFNQITSMSRQTSPGLLTTLGTYLQIAALILIVIQTITLLKKRQVRLKKD